MDLSCYLPLLLYSTLFLVYDARPASVHSQGIFENFWERPTPHLLFFKACLYFLVCTSLLLIAILVMFEKGVIAYKYIFEEESGRFQIALQATDT